VGIPSDCSRAERYTKTGGWMNTESE
jgi:hypothetical protein